MPRPQRPGPEIPRILQCYAGLYSRTDQPHRPSYFGPSFMLYGSQSLHASPIRDLLRTAGPHQLIPCVRKSRLVRKLEEVQPGCGGE